MSSSAQPVACSPIHSLLLKKRTGQPLRHLADLPPQLGIVLRRPRCRHATANTVRILHIIERQNPIARIIAPLSHVIDRHAPTSAAPMLQQRIRQRANRTQIDRRARRHVLRKYADAAFADFAAKAECAARADGAGWATLGASAGGDAYGDGATNGNGLGLRDADYVVAVAVGGGAGVGVGPDGVAKGLNDCFGGFVIPGGAGAEAGAAAIDSEGDGGGIEEEGEGAEAEDGGEIVHFGSVWMVDQGA